MRTLVVLIALTLFAGRPAAAAEAARVNGVVIPAGAVELEMSREPQLRYHRSIAPEKMKQFRAEALERLIDETLFFPEALHAGLAPAPAAVSASVVNAEKNAGGRERLVDVLTKGGLTLDDYARWIRQSDAYDALIKKLKSDVTVSDEDIAARYRERPADFTQDDRVLADTLYVPLEPYAVTAEVEAARVKAAAAGARWKKENPADIEAFAHELGLKYQDMGLVHRGAAMEGIDEALFAMPASTVSETPVRTIYGWHVLRVKERKPARLMPLAEVTGVIRATLLKERGEAAVEKLRAGLRARATISRTD